ncbi:hypothetical protein [Paenibacillus andongensis]|uniref:hypothetical protein n=1 Tax=Paenibacillus andongensis TaxID=2975482 RepID=UPI0021BBB06C|nr:hypothetical protein [Paenibacillus andongensis]
MSNEKVESILKSETKGVGMTNVHTRIKLLFGEEYGISPLRLQGTIGGISNTAPR